jgi:Anti-sigma factor NepR
MEDDKTMLRRAVLIRIIDARLRSQYDAVLRQDVPEHLVDLLSRAMAGDSCEMKRV